MQGLALAARSINLGRSSRAKFGQWSPDAAGEQARPLQPALRVGNSASVKQTLCNAPCSARKVRGLVDFFYL